MNKKRILTALVLAAAAAGAYETYQVVQHARHDLVTLNVTDAPLPVVLARVARQTGERIVADQNLGGTVTLKVRKAPLRRVLGQIADQVGAFSRLNLAVAGTEAKLTGLQVALREGRDLAQAGWTNLAAHPDAGEETGPGRRIVRRGDGIAGPGAPQEDRIDVAMPPGGSAERVMRRIEVRSDDTGGGSTTRATMITTGADGVTHTIDLSPERLLLDEALAGRLSLEGPTPASEESARRLAERAGGKAAAFHTLESLPLPPGGLPPELNRSSWKSKEQGDAPNEPATPDSMEASFKRRRFDQLVRQTPEQRAHSSGGQAGPGPQRVIRVEEE